MITNDVHTYHANKRRRCVKTTCSLKLNETSLVDLDITYSTEMTQSLSQAG